MLNAIMDDIFMINIILLLILSDVLCIGMLACLLL